MCFGRVLRDPLFSACTRQRHTDAALYHLIHAAGHSTDHYSSLVAANDLALGEPVLRDTVEARFAVRAAVPSAQIKVLPDHRRILALR